MKKILFLLLLITSLSYGQAIAPTRVKITNNAISTTAPFVPVQETDGFINKINKSDLIEVLEYASAINLPVTGVAGKIYVTLDNNRLYRWTGTIYQDLGYVDISNKVDKVNGKSLISDTEITRLSTISNFDNSGNVTALNNKVDKVTGKSLLSDAEITRLATLANYTHPANHPPSIITQDGSNRFVTDAEKTAWNAKQTALGFTAENSANKNNANGYAGLGSDGKLISSQLPSITISDTFIAASQAAMLAVTAETGDVVVRTDLNKSFILKGATPTILSDWQELLTPTSAVTTVFGRNGAVTAQSGDYNADQITETATRKFQTANQNTFNDATSSIQTQINTKQATITAGTTAQYYRGDKTMQTLNSTAVGLANVNNTTDLLKPISTATQTALNGKENSFTKNTAFNKNYGNAVGTTAEGNDSRINNGQTAYAWGNHSSKYPLFDGTGAYGNWAINISGNAGTATTATNSTQWTGQYYDNGGSDQNVSSFLTYNVNSNLWTKSSLGHVKTSLGLGSNAYSSTAFTPLNGTGANGTWGININGNAVNLYGNISETSENPSVFKLNSIRYFVNAPGAPTSFFQALTIGDGNDFTQIGSGGDNELYFRFKLDNWKKVWHNGNFNPGNYLPLTGGTIVNGLNGRLNIGLATNYIYGDNSNNIILGNINGDALTLNSNKEATFASSVTASGFFQSSDRRLKTILKRDGDVAYFKWKDNRDNDTHIGYIAQEVKKEFPNQVKADEKGMLSVNYIEVLVAKVQTLEKRIQELETAK